MALGRSIGILAGIAALIGAGPAFADVKAGVDAWSRGDWNAAVAEWQGPANANDPDALFNLGQAYRLGRGVPQDMKKARDYYQRAAKLGHVRAADTYGIILFQDGDRKQAMPYIEDAARRGDPRSEYLLGLALFNGDLVPKDWVRGYALLTLANAQQLPQAAPALQQMNQFIPLEQRQQAAKLAIQLQNDADAARARELAAADLQARDEPENGPEIGAAQPTPVALANSSTRVPQPTRNIEVDPSIDAAREAVRQAMLATGTESPADAGADYARPTAPPRQQAAAPARREPPPPPVKRTPASPPSATPTPPARAPARSAPAGPWKLQLGVFSVSGNAERLWSELQGRAEISGKKRLLVPVGRLTKLLAGGYVSEAEASAACQRLKRAGHDCLVTK